MRYSEGGTYSLRAGSNDRFFQKKFLIAILFTLRAFARNMPRNSRRRNIFWYFLLFEMFDLGFETWLLHYVEFKLTDSKDFKLSHKIEKYWIHCIWGINLKFITFNCFDDRIYRYINNLKLLKGLDEAIIKVYRAEVPFDPRYL